MKMTPSDWKSLGLLSLILVSMGFIVNFWSKRAYSADLLWMEIQAHRRAVSHAAPTQLWQYQVDTPWGGICYTTKLLQVSNGWAFGEDQNTHTVSVQNLGLFPGWKRLK